MPTKAQAIKFEHVDKRVIRGHIGHTRTGACTSRGRCQHGTIAQRGPKRLGKKGK